MSTRAELALTWVGIVLSGAAFALAFADVGGAVRVRGDLIGQAIVMGAIVLLLLYGSLVFQFTRLGAIAREAAHRPRSRAEIRERVEGEGAPSVCILIPSYREEPRVVLQTVLSAALADYDRRRVVVLLDDPPQDGLVADGALLRTRSMLNALNASFAALSERLGREQDRFLAQVRDDTADPAAEANRLAALHEECARWIERQGNEFNQGSAAFGHVDRLFRAEVIGVPAARHRQLAAQLRARALDLAAIAQDYASLAGVFNVEIGTFERKRFANLSHQSNKAMNLNAYIGLIGGAYRCETGPDGSLTLVGCAEGAELSVPHADYVLTLDADSLILHDYIMRLVDVMEREPRLAVAQTPYSAFAGAPTVLERTAGATTDVQYFVHQGFTAYGATYWVGANALLRVSALRDIATTTEEGGHTVPVFIQDRTVIEDTGSTIDLVRRGWRLLNYPERLAYSATPPDFGALVIQRRRWANGGLVILPDLLRLAVARGKDRMRATECLIRAHYLLSPLFGNVGLLALLFAPLDPNLASAWLPVAAVPYYLLYGRDLRRAGYAWRDLARVYALNLLLVPVNLAGVARSIQQILTGRKAPFGRTPKVDGRTAIGPAHILLQAGLLLLAWVSCLANYLAGRPAYALFAGVNAAFLLYAITRMIGWSAALEDGMRPLVVRMPRLQRPATEQSGPIIALARWQADTALPSVTNSAGRGAD